MPAASMSTKLRRASARMTTDAVANMSTLPWFAALPPDERSSVGLVVQAGLQEFAAWLRDTARPPKADPAIFSAAPRALARAVTLQQTVQLIRVTVEVLEGAIPSIASPPEREALELAVLRYSREVAFAAAEVYAAAAEERGAWDARTEASVVDALLRADVSEAVLTRAGSLGWNRPGWATAIAGQVADAAEPKVPDLRASARRTGLCLLIGEHGDELLVVVGGSGPLELALAQVTAGFPPGPVVVGPVVRELAEIIGSLAEARAGLGAVAAWPDAPRPVEASALLAERVILGDQTAAHQLRRQIYEPLLSAGQDLLLTASTYLAMGSVVEATARRLFLHPNTVRYRLRKIAELIGTDVSDPRAAQVVRTALILGRTAPRA